MYTTVSHEFGFDVFDFLLTTYQEDINLRFENNFFLESANLMFKNNTSKFDNKFFLQTKGAAIDEVDVPTYANLTTGY